jgi:hypothetical protein
MPNQEVKYCYYFRTPNPVRVPVKRWASQMTPDVFAMIMFTTTNITSGQPVDKQPPGTVSASNCGFASGGQVRSHWTYAAYTPSAEMALPPDDGAGNPVAMEIAPFSAGFLQIHHFNATDQPVKARVRLDAEALLDAGAAYTKSATYVTYNANISIPPQTTGDVERFTCAVPPGARFWRMSTHAHKQAVRTAVLDNLSVVFESTDWLNPGAQTFTTPPFFTFTSNALTYACTYDNPTNRTITSGDSTATDEQCMAIGHFFPATKEVFCVNSTVVSF